MSMLRLVKPATCKHCGSGTVKHGMCDLCGKWPWDREEETGEDFSFERWVKFTELVSKQNREILYLRRKVVELEKENRIRRVRRAQWMK